MDASFVLDFLGGRKKAVRFMDILQQGSAPLGIAPVTACELEHALASAPDHPHEAQQVQGFLAGLLTFPLTPEAARMVGVVVARAAREGRPLSTLDALIGCTAVHHGQSLVTRDRRDLERIPGLTVLKY